MIGDTHVCDGGGRAISKKHEFCGNSAEFCGKHRGFAGHLTYLTA